MDDSCNTSLMRTFIGVKVIQAMPMSEDEFASYKGKPIPNAPPANRPGYLVRYPDGYESWSPKDVFDAAYLPLSDPTRINPHEVERFIRTGMRFDNGSRICEAGCDEVECRGSMPCEPVSRDLDRDQADHIADRNECGPTRGCDEVQCRGSMPPGVVIDEAAGSSIPQQ